MKFKEQSIQYTITYLGTLTDTLKSDYKIYTLFKKIPTANSFRGNSQLIFLKNEQIVNYPFDLPEFLPQEIKDNRFIYVKDEENIPVDFYKLTDVLCSPFGCSSRLYYE